MRNLIRSTVDLPAQRCAGPQRCVVLWRPTHITLILFSCVWGFSVSSAGAQSVKMAQQRGPYYVGEPVAFQITVNDLDGNQKATCTYDGPPSDDVTVSGPDVAPSRRSFMQSINGRVTRSETVSYQFLFQITASKPGEIDVGPFRLEIDGNVQTLEGTSLEFEELADDPDMELSAEIESNTIYVGQQIPVKISWAFAGDRNELQTAFSRLQIRSPLFDILEFVEQPLTSQTTLTLNSSAGSLEIDAEVRQENRNGKDFVVVSGVQTMTAEKPGAYSAIPVTCRTERVTSWSRSIFGELRPNASRPALAAAMPISFTVRDIPTAGRPDSYSGAVGEGYSIEVSANRSVVRVGDPISLDVTIKGRGNLEKISLPSFRGAGGLEGDAFQLPAELPSGTFSGNAKQFKLSVRVKEQAVNQIPALAFSWFDPKAEKFQTVMSKPIALQVMVAQIVSAADVVSAAPNPNMTVSDAGTGEASDSEANRISKSMNFIGANLAIEKNVGQLLLGTTGLVSETASLVALYGMGLVAIAMAVFAKRWKSSNPRKAEQRAGRKLAIRRISNAKTLPVRQAATEIAETLRERIAIGNSVSAVRIEADVLIAECESLIYAPTETNDPQLLSSLVARAESVVNRLGEGA